jgi:spore maturation protein CgeB
MELFPESIVYLKSKGITVCCYNPDHPFIHSGKGSGNSNVKRSFNYYDFHFVYGLDFIAECEQNGIQVYPLPFAYDLSAFDTSEIFNQQEIFNRVCFIGNPDIERAKFILTIAKMGIKIDVYGTNWGRFIKNYNNISINDPVYGVELWKTFRKYRIQLNLLRKHNSNSHNQRTFELAGAGAVQIAPRTPDHKKYFIEDKEIFLFEDEKECVLKIEMLLNLDDAKVNTLRHNILERVRIDRHTYKNRVDFVFDVLKNYADVNK